MRIALDAMGSDRSPFTEVKGAVEASLADGHLDIVLVGDQRILEEELAKYPSRPNITIRHASEVIRMDDSPAQGVRQKKDSSLLVGMRMVKNGEADAIVSAGNTGAVQVAARIILGPIRGVARSAICQQFPSLSNRNVLLIDLGANVDCSARHLCEFAEMGVVYAERVMRWEHPRVGLINIGEEQLKGNDLAKTVHRNLKAAEHINFIGNVEPMAIFRGEVDVAVCDGFIGNLLLKSSEASAYFVRKSLEREMMSGWLSRFGALLCLGAFKRVKQRVDPNDMPGAPLLGVNGTVIITHGSVKSPGIANAVRGAGRVVEMRINDHIRLEVQKLRTTEACLNRTQSDEAGDEEAAGSEGTGQEGTFSMPNGSQDAPRKEPTDMKSGAAYLFPGQGSQSPGMGQDLYQEAPEERIFFDEAASCLPGLLDIMFKGPAEKLAQTQIAQVALLTVEIALNRRLRSRSLEPVYCAGHSLGEFSALAGAEALSFEEALRLVRARGKCMAENVPEGGMAAVMGLSSEQIEQALPRGVVVANYNGPEQTIISGSLSGMSAAEETLKKAGAKRIIPLPVSGPFHSPLMEKAAEAFERELRTAEIRPPKYRFISSVTGEEAKEPEAIRSILMRQICSPVRWTDVMRKLGPIRAFEVGPGRVLQGLAKRMEGAPRIELVGTLQAANTVEV